MQDNKKSQCCENCSTINHKGMLRKTTACIDYTCPCHSTPVGQKDCKGCKNGKREGCYTCSSYERNYSHTHCWKQKPTPACGIPLEKHTQCCLCDTPFPNKKRDRGLICLCGDSQDKICTSPTCPSYPTEDIKKLETTVEHCDKKDCPECDLKAYNKGRAEERAEFVICAAIRMKDGYIIRGHRHNDCLLTASKIPRYKDDSHAFGDNQGFVTSTGRYVDRIEGAKIQKKAGIKSKMPEGQEYLHGQLYSEDLY